MRNISARITTISRSDLFRLYGAAMKRNIVFLLGAIIALTELVGCPASVQQVYRKSSSSSEIVNKANYTLGVKRTVSIGDSLIERKNYSQHRIRNAIARPTTDMKISRATCVAIYGPCEDFLPADRDYEVMREVLYNDTEYFVVSSSRKQVSKLDTTIYPNSGTLFLVSKDGVPLDRVFMHSPDSVFPNRLIIEPPDVRVNITDKIILETNGYIDEKIIYLGREGNLVDVRFISRTGDESENLVERKEDYKLQIQDEIKFRNFRFKIIEAKPDSLDFIVISDK